MLAFFTDFGKIARNVDNIAIKLHQLNYIVVKSYSDGTTETVKEVR